MKKNLPILLGLAAIIVLTVFSLIYYNRITDSLDLDAWTDAEEYEKHYAMISMDAKSQFWQEIYASAQAGAGEGANAYVELLGEDTSQDYTLADYMHIAIAAKVDGIILQPEDAASTKGVIDEATAAGIPVVTVLEDCSDSGRISFIGVNNYQLGQNYGEQAVSLLHEGDNRVMVLLHEKDQDISDNLIFTQISNTIQTNAPEGMTAQVSSQSIENRNDFDSEETIRDLLMDQTRRPDILICLSQADTARAYQAIVDYNLVGEVQIIGYYYSDTIISAIKKNIIPMTMVVDAKELGAYSVVALEEYKKMGNVSDYFSVNLTVVNTNNAELYASLQEE